MATKVYNIIKRICNKWIYFTLEDRVNIIKTITINFLLLPIKQALHFPIIIYGPCKLGMLTGKVVFLSPIKKGLLKIGLSDPMRSYHSKSFVSIKGTLEIGKNIVLRRGINLFIEPQGHLSLKDDVFIGDNNTINSSKYIEFGCATRVGNNSVFMDTDFHYIINTATREVKKNKQPIIIGTNCWIGGWCTIKKGTQLPNRTIVAGPYSMVGKNYTNIIPEGSLIAGSPAKLLIKDIRRINNLRSEAFLTKYLSENNTYVLPDNENIDTFCMPDTNKKD